MKKTLIFVLILALTLAVGMSSAGADVSSLLPYTGDEIVVSFFCQDQGARLMESKVLDSIYETLGNVRFEFETTSVEDRATKRNLYLSTGDLPDIMIIQGNQSVLTDYWDAGIMLDYSQYEEYMPNYVANRAANPSQTRYDINGQSFFVLPVKYTGPGRHFVFNKTKLDKYGLEVPTTFEELEHVMEVIQEAEPDGYQMMANYRWNMDYFRWLLSDLVGYIGHWENDVYRADEETGAYEFAPMTQGFKDSILLMQDWYEKGYFWEEGFGASEEQCKNKAAKCEMTFFMTSAYNEVEWYFGDTPYDELPIELAPTVITPRGGGKPVIIAESSDSYDWALIVSANTENPELMCSIVDYFVSPEYSTLYHWGWEGETFEIDDKGNKRFIEPYESDPSALYELGVLNQIPGNSISIYDPYADTYYFDDYEKGLLSLWGGMLASGEAEYKYYGYAILTAEESDEVAAIKNPVMTAVYEGMYALINGTRPIEEYDEWVSELYNYGDIDRMIEIYEKAEQSPPPLLSTEVNVFAPTYD